MKYLRSLATVAKGSVSRAMTGAADLANDALAAAPEVIDMVGDEVAAPFKRAGFAAWRAMRAATPQEPLPESRGQQATRIAETTFSEDRVDRERKARAATRATVEIMDRFAREDGRAGRGPSPWPVERRPPPTPDERGFVGGPSRMIALSQGYAPAEVTRVEQIPIDRGWKRADLMPYVSALTGVDGKFLEAILRLESNDGRHDQPPHKVQTKRGWKYASSAIGQGQFIEDTWLVEFNDHAAALGRDPSTMAVEDILALRTDPRWAMVMSALHAQRNARYFRARFNRDPTWGDMYGLHFLGLTGYTTLTRAAASGQTAAAVLPAQARANRGIFYDKKGRARSAAEVRTILARKVGAGMFTDY